MLPYIDGSWIDIGSIVGAFGYALRQHYTRRPRPPTLSKVTGVDFANGTALFPLLILSLAVFSSWLTAQLLTSSKVILSAAGVVALLSLLERDSARGEIEAR